MCISDVCLADLDLVPLQITNLYPFVRWPFHLQSQLTPLALNTRSRTRRHEDLDLLLAPLMSSCSSGGFRSLATSSQNLQKHDQCPVPEGFDRDSLRAVPDASCQKVGHYSSRVVSE